MDSKFLLQWKVSPTGKLPVRFHNTDPRPYKIEIYIVAHDNLISRYMAKLLAYVESCQIVRYCTSPTFSIIAENGSSGSSCSPYTSHDPTSSWRKTPACNNVQWSKKTKNSSKEVHTTPWRRPPPPAPPFSISQVGGPGPPSSPSTSALVLDPSAFLFSLSSPSPRSRGGIVTICPTLVLRRKDRTAFVALSSLKRKAIR